jgi:hypothetical protein
MKPDFSLAEYRRFFRIRTRAAALNFLGRKTRLEFNQSIEVPGLASPYVAVALRDAPGCGAILVLPRLPELRP